MIAQAVAACAGLSLMFSWPGLSAEWAGGGEQGGVNGGVPGGTTRQGPFRITETEAAEHLLVKRDAIHPGPKDSTIPDGVVKLIIEINEQGVVEGSALTVGSHAALTEAAGAAVRQSRYKPFLRDGRPIRASTPVQVPVLRPGNQLMNASAFLATSGASDDDEVEMLVYPSHIELLPPYVGPPLPEACKVLLAVDVAAVTGRVDRRPVERVYRDGANQCHRGKVIMLLEPAIRANADIWAATLEFWRGQLASVPGLGDEAFCLTSSPGSPSCTMLHVRKGKIALSFSMMSPEALTDSEYARALKAIAQKAIAHF